jgi:hypothetical protein
MAMRISLGAGRSRLIRQLLTESLLLSILAGALGWLLAIMAAPALIAMLSTQNEPVKFALAMDTRVLLFCVVVSTAAAVFFGLLPAWQASGARPMRDLRGVPAHSGKLRWGQFFVGVQVAFAFCLIVAGAGFLFSLKNLFAVNLGFDPRNVSMFMIGVNGLSDMTQRPQLSAFLNDFESHGAVGTVRRARLRRSSNRTRPASAGPRRNFRPSIPRLLLGYENTSSRRTRF